MNTKQLICCCTAAFLISGCTIVETKEYGKVEPVGNDKNIFPNGVTYFLPKAMMKLSVTRTADTPKLLQLAIEEFANTKNLLATTKSTLKDTNAKVNSFIEISKRIDPKSSEGKFIFAELRNLSNKVKVLEEQLKDAVVKFEDAKKKKTAATNAPGYDCGFNDTVLLTKLPLRADTSIPLFAKYNHNWLRDDDYKIGTTADGLLTSVALTSADKTGEILVTTTKVILEASKLATTKSLPQFKGATKIEPPSCAKQAFSKREVIFDPSIAEGKNKANELLNTVKQKIEISTEGKGSSLIDQLRKLPEKENKKKKATTPPKIVGGLLYRRPLNYTFALKTLREFNL